MSAGSQDYTTGAGRSHLKDDLIVALRERNDLAAENAELREERALIIQRAENAEAALVAEVAKNGRHAMRVTIAQLEARLQKVMARCADLLDEDQFNELDAIASSASWERDATYAQLAEAQRFPHGAAAVTGCDMKINDEGRSNAAHWHERAMKAEARLAEAERDAERLKERLEEATDLLGFAESRLLVFGQHRSANPDYVLAMDAIKLFLLTADSAKEGK